MKIIDGTIPLDDLKRMTIDGYRPNHPKDRNVMNVQHRDLAAGRWQSFPLMVQLANVGSEVERALAWRGKNNVEYSRLALDRALELLGLTIADPRHLRRLAELTRLREVLLDYFIGDNQFGSTESSWRSYFYGFGYAAALIRRAAEKS